LAKGTWKGGREKSPAAFCRKVICSEKGIPYCAWSLMKIQEFEMWGDGKQTRSYCFVDDCVEGILRLMYSDYPDPMNIGSDEMIR
jgi:GDP-D-mannose 3',5'-epimerase